jgi:hypothetical protein
VVALRNPKLAIREPEEKSYIGDAEVLYPEELNGG